MSVVDRVRDLVTPLLADEGLELFDVEFGGGRIVVVVDRPGGVDLDALTRATQRISALFDREDPVPGGRYLLEVSSPGLERRLRTPAHFQRFLGSKVAVKTRPGAEGERRLTGQLTEADEDGFTVNGRRFAYADTERVQTIFEWGPAPRPGRTPARPKPAASGAQNPTSTQKAPAS